MNGRYDFQSKEEDWEAYVKMNEKSNCRGDYQNFQLDLGFGSDAEMKINFFNYSNRHNLDPENINSDADLKRGGLRLLGLRCLKSGKENVPLENCSERRVGGAFRDKYKGIVKFLVSQNR